jgi:hypothetical protein
VYYEQRKKEKSPERRRTCAESSKHGVRFVGHFSLVVADSFFILRMMDYERRQKEGLRYLVRAG